VYVVHQDDAQQSTIVFGDGVRGARPPTGIDNIHARYRYGLGSSGNVPADGVAQLLDSLAGIQKVTNPLPTAGGVDPDSAEQIRAKAPTSLNTFDRAIGPSDFALLALTFGDVAKASASWQPDGGTPHVRLTVALADHSPLLPGSAFARQLRTFLGSRAAPGMMIRLRGYTSVEVDVAIELELDDGAPRTATLAAVRAALDPGQNPDGSFGFFAFERLALGQPILLSAVYAAVQAVGGVRAAYVTTLRRPDRADAPQVGDVEIAETELAVVPDEQLTFTLRAGGFGG
jgi:predicted phage baseplate assembly protein